jgi:hypothetical protein
MSSINNNLLFSDEYNSIILDNLILDNLLEDIKNYNFDETTYLFSDDYIYQINESNKLSIILIEK